jgi:hypothetical protein
MMTFKYIMSARTGHAVVIALLSGLAAPALGQHALDRNLQQGSGGINQSRPDFGAEVRFRNAVVTGNAPGGAAFRGSVGYTAPGEFFGALGSNDTFAFRRDSVYSGLGGLGIRGTDALQYQFAMTTGNAPPPGAYGLPFVGRSGSGAMVSTVTPAAPRAGFGPGVEPGTRGIDFGHLDGDLMPMRSPSAYVSSRGLQPTLLGMARDAEGQTQTLTASGLRGISFALEPQRRAPIGGEIPTGLPARDEQDARPAGDEAQRRDMRDHSGDRQAFGPAPGEGPATVRRPGQPDTPGQLGQQGRLDQRLSTAADLQRSPYEDILARIRAAEQADRERARLAEQGEPEQEWERRLAELRDQLRDQRQGRRPAAEPGAIPAARPPGEISAETAEMIRRGGDVQALAPEGFDAYSNAMRLGEELLAAGRYFDAEARFTSALSARPGDPMAAAGRVHAALGAGMFLSAALNLRTLLTDNPEVAGVRYAPNLLPSAERLPTIKARLRQLLEEAEGGDADLGLLLAYLGWQTRDAAAVEEGLEAMASAQTPEHVRRLGSLLRRVWVVEPAGEQGK